jgi:hypothetical protein
MAVSSTDADCAVNANCQISGGDEIYLGDLVGAISIGFYAWFTLGMMDEPWRM